jgi:hypothetical protein
MVSIASFAEALGYSEMPRDLEDLNKFLISIHTVQTLLPQSFKQSSFSVSNKHPASGILKSVIIWDLSAEVLKML